MGNRSKNMKIEWREIERQVKGDFEDNSRCKILLKISGWLVIVDG